ncbi:MAG: RNase H family protein [Pirellulaceae bacterium]
MSVPTPHFLLFSEAFTRPAPACPAPAQSEAAARAGRWRFVLQHADGQACLEAADEEPETSTERLELLAIVRGLEAIDEPSQVTLVAGSRSIGRGIRYGLAQWRENDWHWERYGKLTPVKNGDLWQRIDRAMAIHSVKCREPAAEASDDLAEPPVVRREIAGRRLRIDPGPRSSLPQRSPRQARPDRVAKRGWFARLGRALAQALRPRLTDH